MNIKTLTRKLTLSNILMEYINSDNGYFIGRYGNVEMSAVANNDTTQLHSNAGFYWDTQDQLDKFKKVYFESILDMDIYTYVVTCDSFKFIEDFIISAGIFRPSIPYVEYPDVYLKVMETLHKNNLNVCIVANDIELMKKQQKNIREIHNNNYDLNSENIKFVKSHNTVQGMPKPFDTWEKTLDDLEQRCLEADCKYYYLGCGCYGLPLARRLKAKKKNVWYVGGIIQLLFGILGKRWEGRPEILSLINFYWTYPKKHIVMDGIEGGGPFNVGCYN